MQWTELWHAVAEVELRQNTALESKDADMAALKSQLDGAQRQHNVELTRLQIEVIKRRP